MTERNISVTAAGHWRSSSQSHVEQNGNSFAASSCFTETLSSHNSKIRNIMNTHDITPGPFCDMIVSGAAEVLEVKWYRDNPANKALCIRARTTNKIATVFVTEGTHAVYDLLKSAAE
jgi:hypothetical protein